VAISGVSRGCLGLSGAFLGHVEFSRDQERFTNPLSKLLCPSLSILTSLVMKNKHSGTPSSRGGFRLSNKNIIWENPMVPLEGIPGIPGRGFCKIIEGLSNFQALHWGSRLL
jgi:hypothetical protein